MAGRFHRGGRLLAFGSPSDAAHIVVEFVHPVIIGKRALPAQSLPGDVALQLGLFGQPADIALAITPDSGDERLVAALATARRMGMLTVALLGAGAAADADHVIADHVITVASDDERVVREVQVTAYHVLWELVHVFLDAPEVLA